jgi:hypothetical protein
MGVSDVDAEDSGTESNGETIAADAHGNSVDLPIERPLVILQLTPTLNSGGVERGTIDIARAITAAGGRALVATAGGRMEAALRRAGGEILKMSVGAKTPWAIFRNALRLARIVRAEGVDVIHARSRAPAWAGLLAAKWTGCAFVTTYHGAYRENAPFKRLYNSGAHHRRRPRLGRCRGHAPDHPAARAPDPLEGAGAHDRRRRHPAGAARRGGFPGGAGRRRFRQPFRA